MSKTILVTGATGNQGGAVARELLKNGYSVKAMTRKPESEKAQDLKKLGADIVQGDLNDFKSLHEAIKGVWGVFAVQNTWEAGVEGEEEQGKRLAEIARKENVYHYVYSSVASAHRKTEIPHFDNKYRVEDRIRELGFPSYTIIRPVFFMENYLMPFFKPGIDEGKLTVGIKPDTRLQVIAVEDIGKVAFLAFEKHKEFNGLELDIAGDELTMPETADIISRKIGKQIEFAPTPIEHVRQFSDDFATMLEWFDQVGYDANITKISQLTGVTFTGFNDWAAKADWS